MIVHHSALVIRSRLTNYLRRLDDLSPRIDGDKLLMVVLGVLGLEMCTVMFLHVMCLFVWQNTVLSEPEM